MNKTTTKENDADNGSPNTVSSNKLPNNDEDEDDDIFAENQYIYDTIKSGYRILVLMRGAPGSGKSYLADKLVNKTMNMEQYRKSDFIFSTDSFFIDRQDGSYRFRPDLLTQAHLFNQERVNQYASTGWSPIIVDNTNMQKWEMMPYVESAVKYGYIVEILEPSTRWCRAPALLAQRNKHNVPRDKIEAMLDRYEKITAKEMIASLKQVRYRKKLPQKRDRPPLYIKPKRTDVRQQVKQQLNANANKENVLVTNRNEAIWDSYDTTEQPKAQRQNKYATNPWQTEETDSLATAISSIDLNEEGAAAIIPEQKKTLLDLLREGLDEVAEKNMQKEQKTIVSEPPKFVRHSVDCSNENIDFVTLRQVYCNKNISSLWDLFVKCNGDAAWAVDILMKEDDLTQNQQQADVIEEPEVINDDFICTCSGRQPLPIIQNPILLEAATTAQTDDININDDIKPKRQRQRALRTALNDEQHGLKTTLERSFVIADEHYSDFVRNVRDIRHGHVKTEIQSDENTDNILPTNETDVAINTEDNVDDDDGLNNVDDDDQNDDDNDNDNDDDDDDDDDNDINNYEVTVTEQEEFIEVNLGENLIEQLNKVFKAEILLNHQVQDLGTRNIFIPRSLGKELYMSWVESNYNLYEEQRRTNEKNDEEFAQLIANPKYAHFAETPGNVRELLDMEVAWSMYNRKEIEYKETLKQIEPKDLASHITQMKLFETFPNIPQHVLIDILAAHDFQYNETIDVVHATLKYEEKFEIETTDLTAEKLLERVLQENVNQNTTAVDNPSTSDDKPSTSQANASAPKSNYDYFCFERVPNTNAGPKHNPDEAKHLALRDFEDARNLAAYHCQLKAECYQKAKNAIQQGSTGVAVYYSQIANLHKKKIDMYNHRAANCIIEVHQYTQKNPDLLDLHYLHAIEAVNCLDIFLDRHIHDLRMKGHIFKNIFVITGRGLHSAGGISTIKNRVRLRLKERGLRWSEVNPGLLKIKIYAECRFAVHK